MNIKLNRENRLGYSLQLIDVQVDGKFTGCVKNGGSLMVQVPDGEHGISLMVGGKTKAFIPISGPSDGDVDIVFWVESNGCIEYHSASAVVGEQAREGRNAGSGSGVGSLIAVVLFVLLLLFLLCHLKIWLVFTLVPIN